MIAISAIRWAPPFARGQVRYLRVRWALEEAGLPYRARLLEQGDQDEPEYRALQPFGQAPILGEDGLVLFGSGAIVLHIGERSETLLPRESAARARAVQWVFAALNSVEPSVVNAALIDSFYADQTWAQRRQGTREFAQRRLAGLARSLGEKPYLDGDRFTVGDLMMATALRIQPDLIETGAWRPIWTAARSARPSGGRSRPSSATSARTTRRPSARRPSIAPAVRPCGARGCPARTGGRSGGRRGTGRAGCASSPAWPRSPRRWRPAAECCPSCSG